MLNKFLILIAVVLVISACSLSSSPDEGNDDGGEDGKVSNEDAHDDGGYDGVNGGDNSLNGNDSGEMDDDGDNDNGDNAGLDRGLKQEKLAMIDDFKILLQESDPIQVMIQISGNLRNGCEEIKDVIVQGRGDINITITTKEVGDICTQALVPFERTVTVDTSNYENGTYKVTVNGELAKTFEL